MGGGMSDLNVQLMLSGGKVCVLIGHDNFFVVDAVTDSPKSNHKHEFHCTMEIMTKTLSLKMQCNRSRFIQENYTWGENRSINSGATGCLGGLTFTRNCNPRLPPKSVNSDLVFFVVDRYVPPLFLALWIL